MLFSLRPYQVESSDELRDGYRRGFRRQVLVSPTGSGKTLMFAFATKSAWQRGHRTLILSHRAELIRQITQTLTNVEVPHGVLCAGQRTPNDPVVVASVATLVKRLDEYKKPDFIVIDEFHHCAAATWVRVLAQFSEARVLGVTATPERLDGKGLAAFADRMVRGPEVQWLIDNGYLARPRYFSPQHLVDTSGLRKTAGDFNKADSAALMDKPTITGDAVQHYRRHCPGKRAIAFCVSVAHAEHVAEQFRYNGIPSASIDGTMTDVERSLLISQLGAKVILVLTSCELVSEGVDIPVVDAAILLRPTESLAMHLQHVGRVLRPAPGKDFAYILDSVGNCMKHGLAEERREWSLEGGAGKKRKQDDPIIATRRCEKCYAIFVGKICPQCSTPYESKVRQIETRDGQLRELSPEEIAAIRQRKSEEAKCDSLQAFRNLAKARGFKPGWAFHRWKNSWRNHERKANPV